MASSDHQTLVLHPDSKCSSITSLLGNINKCVLKVHEHCLGDNALPLRRSQYDVSRKDSDDEINPGCRLCSVAVDGVSLKKRKSRTYGVEAAEEAYEHHQRNDEKRSGKEVCHCSPPPNICVKIKSDEKEIVEWFTKTRAERTLRGKATPVKAPFIAVVKHSTTTETGSRDDIQLNVSIDRVSESSTSRNSKGKQKSVHFEDQDKRTFGPIFTGICNFVKRVTNMFSCGRNCQCKEPPPESESRAAGEETTNSSDSQGSLNNLVVKVDSNSGEEKFVRMSSWDTTKDAPATSSDSDFNDSNARDIVEILGNRKVKKASSSHHE